MEQLLITQKSSAFGRPCFRQIQGHEHKTTMTTAVVFIVCDDVSKEAKYFRTFGYDTVFEEYSMWQPFRDSTMTLRFLMNMGGIQDPTCDMSMCFFQIMFGPVLLVITDFIRVVPLHPDSPRMMKIRSCWSQSHVHLVFIPMSSC